MDDFEDGPSFKPERGKRLQDFYRKMDVWGEKHL
jgi:hypothetical protein